MSCVPQNKETEIWPGHLKVNIALSSSAWTYPSEGARDGPEGLRAAIDLEVIQFKVTHVAFLRNPIPIPPSVVFFPNCVWFCFGLR